MRLKKVMKWWLPVILWMGVIFIGSSIGSIPRAGGPALDGLVHRVGHLLEFAILGMLVTRALSQERPITRRNVIVTLIVIALYGASDEFHQRFTPGRSSEGLAVLFDAVCGALGIWIYRRWLRRKRTHQQPEPAASASTDPIDRILL